MKKTRTKLIAVLLSFCLLLSMIALLLFCLTLYGCSRNLRNYFYTEESLKRVAAKALKEKYDEEFVIHDVWSKNQTTFFALCSPKYDNEVDFKADIYKDGSGVYADGYVQGIIAEQINENLQEDFQSLFKDCYTRAEMYNYYNLPIFENVKDITIEEYLSQVNVDFAGYDVFILSSEVSQETVDAEYEMFSKKIQDKVINGIIPDVVVDLYFVDEQMLKMSREYYATYEIHDSDFEKALDNYPNISFAYPDNKINKTYEEYKTLRMEIETNE